MDLLENLDYMVCYCFKVENMMMFVERVILYIDLDLELGYSLQKKLLRDWLVEGWIEFKDVFFVYYRGGFLVLRDLNLLFVLVEKVGIVG